MGLDMYLTAVRKDGTKTEVAYWRKANAIHRWFVDEVQGGEDECNPYPVTRDKLAELRDTCTRVQDSPELAERLLPTIPGFFFGPTEYDGWYRENLDATVEQITNALNDTDNVSFVYQSSW